VELLADDAVGLLLSEPPPEVGQADVDSKSLPATTDNLAPAGAGVGPLVPT